ncbi:hypothetical protein FNO01nite_22700 [Flavobacterium noncentrifugens]|uniref:SusE outer membrane protein n=1 Tax=Flavobacterium noncentrifugens TaxID=1128970 RepID=A0A1G9AV29_9FLAO|nr:SusE domain-containing protein [Flavobacterium noncentrifugens]GEP51598.1 hypothetical protein FNO01nite_22700 [Flavobacterium noncentrifugens]SDK31249.1 SusE outer membrane protein [Flavobacterium noncentrifugens]
MRKILNLIILASCIATLSSCEDDKDPVTVANGFEMRSSAIPAPFALLPINDANKVISITWDKSDNGVANPNATYTIEIAASGTNFAAPLTMNNGANVVPAFSYDLYVSELNKLANQLPTYVCGQEMTVDIRVKSVLGSGFANAFAQYSSNFITLKFTPYSTLLPTMHFATVAPSATATANLASSSILTSDYEGYMWLEPGAYKFYKSNSCGTFETPVVYGGNGTGTIAENGAAYQVVTAGFYLVKADLTAATYSVKAVSWNFFGPAKTSFTGANTALVYDPASGLWKSYNSAASTSVVTLGGGFGIQFRATATPAASGIVLGAYDPAKTGDQYAGPTMSYGNSLDEAYLFVPGTRTPRVNSGFIVTLDLRSPRNYKYSITPAP